MLEHRQRTFWMLTAAIEIPLVAAAWWGDPGTRVIPVIFLLILASLFYLVSAWFLLHFAPPRMPQLLFAALLFRITLLPVPPGFTDDLYRYRWEGKIQTFGFNPYTTPPEHAALAGLRDPLYPRIEGKALGAVYGPLIELEQRAVYTLAPGLSLMPYKLAAALGELLVLLALWRLLAAHALARERLLLYAWCPLPIFEFWGMGHHDSLVLAAVVAALVCARRSRDSAAAVWLSIAAMAKLWPLLLFPAVVRRPVRALAILAATALAAFAPYFADLSGNAQLASGFLGGWRNNDSLHAAVAYLARDPYRAKYITIALLAVSIAAIARMRIAAEARVLASIVATLALSANVHPWYIAWVTPLFVLYPLSGLMLWTSLAPLVYSVLIEWKTLGVWNGLQPLRWWVYPAVAAVLLFNLRSIRRQSG